MKQRTTRNTQQGTPTATDENLYLLSFIDVIDRIDIFILEIRHLQQSIIYNLHAPSLYLPLRFEEEFVLEADWVDELWEKTDGVWDARLASRNIIRYPSPRRAVSAYQKNAKRENDYLSEITRDDKKGDKEKRFVSIKRHLRFRIGTIWMGDDWSKDQRHQYYILRTLQILKQQIVRLKFTLSRAAIKANLIGKQGTTQQLDPAAFVVLRRGIIISLRRYVKVFNNHRQQVAQSLDFGLPQDPSPSLERRREIGLFADYMSSSGEQMHHDMLNLLSHFGLKLPLAKVRPLVFHSWSHSHEVDNFHLYDDVFKLQQDRYLLNNEYGLQGGQNISYINSSFWLPDRPDLYPIAAREVAVSVVREQLKDLDDVVFATYNDSFTELLLLLQTELSKWSRKHPELAFIEDSIPHALQTFAADLLAATVKGVSYLYALFLIRLGDNLENQLYLNRSLQEGRIRFDMAYLLENGTAPFEQDMLWYFQFHIVATWIESTNHILPSSLDMIVINGVRTISDDVLKFLDRNIPPKRPHCARLLKGMRKELENIIRQHPIIQQAKSWREQRSQDYWNEKSQQYGKGHFPRTAQRLDLRLQNYLYRLLLKQKMASERGLLLDEDDEQFESKQHALEQHFKDIYPLKIDEHTIPDVDQVFHHPKNLFRHVYDIPFQCSVMRSIDLIDQKNPSWKKSWQYIWEQIHHDMAQGRDLFSIALEFHTREVESPCERLMQCVNLVTNVLRVLIQDNEAETLQRHLRIWLSGDKSSTTTHAEIKKIISNHQGSFDEMRQECVNEDDLIDISAATLSTEFFSKNSYEHLFIRRLEFLSKCKLYELFKFVNKYCQQMQTKDNYKKLKNYQHLIELRHTVALQHSQRSRQDYRAKEEFYSVLLMAFGDKWDRKQHPPSSSTDNTTAKYYPPLPHNLKTSLISRLVMTNIYPILNPKNPQHNPYASHYSHPLEQVLATSFWFNKKNTPKKKIKEASHTMLGRYDAIVTRKTKWPCRCRVQTFYDNAPKQATQDNENHHQNNYIEKFVPYFSHRETALYMDIDNQQQATSENTGKSHFRNKEVFSIVVISLQRRPMRLDFLFRLLRGEKDSYLEGLGAQLETYLAKRDPTIHIRAYLTDGWGDIVLFFSQSKPNFSIKSIDWIHGLQLVLFGDVMVDRTETLFSPFCVDYAITAPNYKVGVKVRLLEDRWLSYGSKRFRELMLKRPLPEVFTKNHITMNLLTIPGRTDYHIIFYYQPPDNQETQNDQPQKQKVFANFHQEMINWFANSTGSEKASIMQLIDHIETILEKNISQGECLL